MTTTASLPVIEVADGLVGVTAGLMVFVCTVTVTCATPRAESVPGLRGPL
jgi:hypothetical protein